MTHALNFENLTTPQGQKNFHRYAGEQLRQKSFALIEAEIQKAISKISDPIAGAALQAFEQPTELIGHDNLVNFITETIANNHIVTALGIDLYGNDCGEGDVALEVSVYDNTSFPFRISTVEEIQAAAETSSPWQGGFIECDYGLGITGLGRLRDIWVSGKHVTESKPTHEVLSCLLEAAIYSRVHKCLHLTLPSLGLPKAMPVIIGENDWGRAPRTVFYVEKVLNPAEARPIPSQASKDTKATWSQQVKLDRNARIRSTYETVNQLPPKLFQSKLQRRGIKLMIGLAKSELAFSKVDMPPNLFRMPREDFDQFMSLLERMYDRKT